MGPALSVCGVNVSDHYDPDDLNCPTCKGGGAVYRECVCDTCGDSHEECTDCEDCDGSGEKKEKS